MECNEFVFSGVRNRNNDFFEVSDFMDILQRKENIAKGFSDTLYQMFDKFHKNGYKTPNERFGTPDYNIVKLSGETFDESMVLMCYEKQGNFVELSGSVTKGVPKMSLRFILPKEDRKILAEILDSNSFAKLRLDFKDNKMVGKFIQENNKIELNFKFHSPRKHIIQKDSTWTCMRKILQPDGKFRTFQSDFDSFDEAAQHIKEIFNKDKEYLRFLEKSEQLKIISDFKNSFGNGKLPKYAISGEYRDSNNQVVSFNIKAEVSKCKMMVKDKSNEIYSGR